MKTKTIAQTVFLLAALSLAVWLGIAQWRDGQKRRDATLNVKQKPVAALPTAALPKPDSPPPARYADVAQKNLFSKDRNPDVVIEPPKVEAPKPMPPLPVVYGVMGLPSGMRALMAEKPGVSSQVVRVGDQIGEFKLVALDSENVAFEWDGKEIKRKIEDLTDKGGPPGAASGPAVSAPTAANSAPTFSAPPASQTQGQQPAALNSINASNGVLGTEIGPPGQSQRACKPGDSSPAGTLAEGYKKVLTPSPLGFSACRWVQQ